MPNLLRVVVFFILLISGEVKAQVGGPQHSFSLHQDFHDYNVKLIEGKFSSFDSSLSQTTRIGYFTDIGKSWGLTAGLNNGYLHHQYRQDHLIPKAFIFGLDAGLQLKMNNGRILKEHSRIGPYLLFGYQLDYMHKLREKKINPFQMRNAYGMGLNVRIGSNAVLQLQTNIEQELGGGFNTHLRHRFGYVQRLGKKRDMDAFEEKEYDELATAPILNDALAERQQQIRIHNDSLNQVITRLNDSLSLLQSDILDLKRQLKESEDKIATLSASAEEENTDTLVKIESEVQQQKPAIEKDSMNKEEVIVEREDSEVKTREEPAIDTRNWYVVVLSTKNMIQAKKSLEEFNKEYNNVRLLPQANGLIRVGIYATSDRDLAEKLLVAVRQLENPSAWLSYE